MTRSTTTARPTIARLTAPLVLAAALAAITAAPAAAQFPPATDAQRTAGARVAEVRFGIEALTVPRGETVTLTTGLYDADGQTPEASENFELLQGVLEKSNVIGIAEMNRMMQIVQSYKSISSLVDQEHERQRRAIEILGASMAS